MAPRKTIACVKKRTIGLSGRGQASLELLISVIVLMGLLVAVGTFAGIEHARMADLEASLSQDADCRELASAVQTVFLAGNGSRLPFTVEGNALITPARVYFSDANRPVNEGSSCYLSADLNRAAYTVSGPVMIRNRDGNVDINSAW